MHAQNSVILVRQDLHNALAPVENQGLAVASHGELTHGVLDAVGLALLLSKAYRGSLRLHIDAGGTGGLVVVHTAAQGILCSHLAHGGGGMGQL